MFNLFLFWNRWALNGSRSSILLRITIFQERQASLLAIWIFLILRYSFHWCFWHFNSCRFFLLILCHAINLMKFFHYLDRVLFFRRPSCYQTLRFLSRAEGMSQFFDLLFPYFKLHISQLIDKIFCYRIQYNLSLICNNICTIILKPVDEERLLDLIIPLLDLFVSLLLYHWSLLIYFFDCSCITLNWCLLLVQSLGTRLACLIILHHRT